MTQAKPYIDMDREQLIQAVCELKDENLNLRKSLDVRDKTVETLCLIIDQLKVLSLRFKKSCDEVLTPVEGTPNLTGTCATPTTHAEVAHGSV